jgi:hypothetical protein
MILFAHRHDVLSQMGDGTRGCSPLCKLSAFKVTCHQTKHEVDNKSEAF